MTFFSDYKLYIQVEVSGPVKENFIEAVGYVESRIRHYIPPIEAGNLVTTHLLPKSFDVVMNIHELCMTDSPT